MTDAQHDPSAALSKALVHDDDLVAVVRGHIYIEQQVNRLIKGLFPYPEKIDYSRLGWPQRVELSLALGLKAQYGPPLKKLGTIRNKFAHRPEVTLADSDVKELYQCLHTEDRDIVLESYKLTQSQVADPPENQFQALSAKSRFALIVAALHSLLRLAVKETGKPAAWFNR